MHWTAALRRVSWLSMEYLRNILGQCIVVVITAMLVIGSVGMDAASAAQSHDTAHSMDQAVGHGSDCPTMDQGGAPVQTDHAACTMTACCFSDIPDLSVLAPHAQPLSVGYSRPMDARLTEAEPKRAKKPPKPA